MKKTIFWIIFLAPIVIPALFWATSTIKNVDGFLKNYTPPVAHASNAAPTACAHVNCANLEQVKADYRGKITSIEDMGFTLLVKLNPEKVALEEVPQTAINIGQYFSNAYDRRPVVRAFIGATLVAIARSNLEGAYKAQVSLKKY